MFSWFQQRDSAASNQKQRVLGAAANSLMQASQQYMGHGKIGEVLHLEGPYISLEALSTAISRLQRRHPVLRSRLQVNPEKPNTYLLEEDDALSLRIREVPRKRTDHLMFWLKEWKEREKDTTPIGQGLAEFWLLQDPNDENDKNSPREIVFICEHSVCDGLSLSTVAHELLISLTNDDNSMFTSSLNWPVTMEVAIGNSLSKVHQLVTLIRFIAYALYQRVTNSAATLRIPLCNVDFPLVDMAKYCHTALTYCTLTPVETQKLVEKCRQEGVTVTCAVSSAMLCTLSTLVEPRENQPTALSFTIGADTRRRCIPPVPNHDLSYQVSTIMPFYIATRDIPTTREGMWQLSKTFSHHIKASIDAGQVLGIGIIMGRLFQKMSGPPNPTVLPTCGISSWGILPFRERYGEWKLAGMTPFMNMVRCTLPFTTMQNVNGVLTILYAGNDPVIPVTLLEDLRDGTMQRLNQMVSE